MTAASSDKNPSGVHFPVHKRFFGAAKPRSLYFLTDSAKEKPARLGRFEDSARMLFGEGTRLGVANSRSARSDNFLGIRCTVCWAEDKTTAGI
jgi:hypothetical protein